MSGTGVREPLDDRVARLELALAETIDQAERRSTRVEDRVRRLERRLQPDLPATSSPDSSVPQPRSTGPRQADPGAPQANPGAPQADPGGPRADPGAPQANPGARQADPGAPQADPGGPQADPGAPQADPGGPQADPGARQANPGARQADTRSPGPYSTVEPARREWDPTALSDLVGGRLLAWLGGLAVLVAIVLFLVLAVSHGWIGEQARVLLAGAASAGLLAAGVWLRAHRGRTEAATTMVGAGTAGLFATLTVAGEVYRVAPALVCLAVATVVGAVATTLAIRWAGRAIAALGLGGALLAPVLVGAPSGPATLAVLGITTVCAMAVAARQNWRWLGLGAVALTAPQWAAWTLGDRSAFAEIVVVGGFALVGLAGGVAGQVRSPTFGGVADPKPGADPSVHGSIAAVGLLTLNACLAAVVGYVALHASAGHAAGVLWLGGLAAVHAGVAFAPRLREISATTRGLLLGVAVLLGDVAFGLSADGLLLTVGWAAVSVALAWALRRRPDDARLLEVGLGAHVGLVLIRVLLAAPPSSLGAASESLVALLSISTLAATALACAQLSSSGRPRRRAALNALGLISIAYLTAGALDGAALAAAWAIEGLALTRLSRGGDGDETAWIGGLGFLGLAATHALLFEAPPTGLVHGLGDLGPAVIGLGAIVCASFTAGRVHPPGSTRRRDLFAACGLAGLYLMSVALVGVLERRTPGAGQAVLDLGVRQQAQVALSGFWSVAGLAALTLGLRRRLSGLRIGGLALLLVAVGKVFTYDLSALDSIYRVASVLTLGLLLLIAALTYQRLRPPASPDLRTLHPSQR